MPNTSGQSLPKLGELYVPNVIVGKTKKLIAGSQRNIAFIT